MYRPDCCYKEASPYGGGCPLQNPKQEQDVASMQQHVLIMLRARIQSEELAIQHMRQPCHRMPVGLFKAGEGPTHIGGCQSGTDMDVVGDVGVVVPEAEEIVMYDREIEEQRRDDERSGQQESPGT